MLQSRDMKQPKLVENVEDTKKAIESKWNAVSGRLPDPGSFTGWTHNSSSIPNFTFADLYTYLVGNEDYTEEILRSFKI